MNVMIRMGHKNDRTWCNIADFGFGQNDLCVCVFAFIFV